MAEHRCQQSAESQGDGGGDHARSAPSYLSGIHPLRTEGEDVRAGTTIDQIAAQKISQDTPLPSLELGIEDYRTGGRLRCRL